MSENPAGGKGEALLRQIGLITVIAYAVGSVIGSGIFRKPALMASQLGSPLLLLLVWAVAGVMTLFGALSVAEMSGMFTQSGGQYVYFNRAYGRLVGYLYGWAVFVVIQTGSIASIAYVFSDSLGYFFRFFRLPPAWEAITLHLPFLGGITPFRFMGLKLCTIALVLSLTLVNYLGVKLGGAVQIVFTALKIGAIALIVVFALTAGGGHVENFLRTTSPLTPGHASIFLAFIVAMSGAFWAYDGWINVTYIAGEVRNSQRNLPRALAIAAVIYIVVYLLLNVAYFYVIPVGEMAGNYVRAEASGQSYLVATDVAARIWKNWGGALIAVAIMISTFGTVNGTIMLSARVYYAMAREGHFFSRLKDVHPRFHTPGKSLWAQGFWTSVLVLSGTFDQLTDMLILVSWIFYAAGALGVIVLRRRMPDAPRPYKVWGYPVVPWLFILFSSVFIVFTVYSDVQNYLSGRAPMINSLLGIALVALGLPGYFFWRRREKRQQAAD